MFRSNRLFERIVLKSISFQRGEVAVTIAAVVLASSLIAALASISIDVGSKAGQELRAYGANLVLVPRATGMPTGLGGLSFGSVGEEDYLPEGLLDKLSSPKMAEYLSGFAPFLYAMVEIGQHRAVMAGSRLGEARKMSPWWQVEGEWPESSSEAVIGAKVARELQLTIGNTFSMAYGQKTLSVRVVGVINTGGQEDGQILVELEPAQALTERPGLISIVQVSALAAQKNLEDIKRELDSAIPEAQAKVVGQIAHGEEALLWKIRLLVGLVAGLVLFASGLTLMSTRTAMVLGRTQEIGLMKALGASKRRIASFLLAEGLVMSLAGGAIGYVLGLGLAELVTKLVFAASTAIPLISLPLTLGLAVALVVASSIGPMRRALDIEPATTLRGE